MNDPEATEKDEVPQISDAEWRIMRVIWRLGQATTAQVISELESRESWKPKTIQTLIGRLAQKGALSFEKQGREYLYTPTIDERTCSHDASCSFLDRVFDGKLAPFLANFVDQQDYTAEELAELKRVLEEKGND